MFHLDDTTNENNNKHNEKWPFVPDNSHIILIIGKTNALLNLIKGKNGIDKIHFHAKDLSEPKYQILIEKRENAGIEHLNAPKAFIEC